MGVGGTLVEVHMVLAVLPSFLRGSDVSCELRSEGLAASATLSEERDSSFFIDAEEKEEEGEACELQSLVIWKRDAASFGWPRNGLLGQSPRNELGLVR